MPVTEAQKTAIEEIIGIIKNVNQPKKKRKLVDMFMDLVNREVWADYYQVIPEPRSINGITQKLHANKYKDPLVVYEDLQLVFLNALYYNEEGSQIAKDAATLKGVLETEWAQRSSVLPVPPGSLPSKSAQKTHEPAKTQGAPVASTSTAPPPPSTPVIRAPEPKLPYAPMTAVRTTSIPTPTSAMPVTPSRSRAARLPPKPDSATATIALPAATTPTISTTAINTNTANANHVMKSPQRASSPDIDVDIGGTPEPESMGAGDEIARDEESDAVVQQLEKGLPRWGGPGEDGWWTGSEGGSERWVEIVMAVKGHKDVIGNRLAQALEAVPEDAAIPYLSLSGPLSLKLIESRARSNGYASSKEFDKDMERLFEKCRRWHEQGSEQYGRVLLLQRLYQAITSPNPPPGPPYASTTNFAGLRAGPGVARPLHSASDSDNKASGVTTFRVSTKDRTFVDELQYKGWNVRLADWLHLANPDDPARPIVAQVFKCWTSDEPAKKGQPHVTVAWYFRPEQTIHPAVRQFWEGEVFKTSHFADHPIEDLIEKIACQFTARHIRGRPRPPYWYLGWPLYVCDSRYNDRDRIFVKIKNWNSCVPEEVRKSTEFMPIYPFERMVHPRRFGSPFLMQAQGGKGGGVKGPGGIGEPVSEKVEGEKGGERKRSKRAGPPSGTDISGPSKGLYVGVPGATTGYSTAGTSAAAAQYLQHTQQQQVVTPQVARAQSSQPRQPQEDRSIVTAAGGMAILGNYATVEKLPAETAKHFDRDPETNEVLWFAAPPINIAHTPAPRYSLKYLHWLATKRKRESESEDSNAMDVDEARDPSHMTKKRQIEPMRTMTETIGELLADFPMDEVRQP